MLILTTNQCSNSGEGFGIPLVRPRGLADYWPTSLVCLSITVAATRASDAIITKIDSWNETAAKIIIESIFKKVFCYILLKY